MFDAKIYKIVDGVFDVSLCLAGDKKFFQISDFCFQLQADLIDFLEKILPRLTQKTLPAMDLYLTVFCMSLSVFS